MANTSSRALRLLSLLQSRRYWPGTELALRLDVSIRTLRRDVERLRDLGYPVEARRGVDGGYQLAPGTAMPPLALDDDEAVSLALGLQEAASTGITGAAESSVRALAKLVRVMPSRLRRRVETLRSMTVPAGWSQAGPTTDPAMLVAVSRACQDVERLEFGYTAADGFRSGRHVEPLRLVCMRRRWYLVAYDLTRQDWRSFRLDRMHGPRATGVPFRPRTLPAEDAAAFVRTGMARAPRSYHAEAVVHAPAADVRERLGRWATVEEVDGQRCRVRMRADVLDWPAMALGAVGAEFDDVRPPEFAELLRDWARRFDHATTDGRLA